MDAWRAAPCLPPSRCRSGSRSSGCSRSILPASPRVREREVKSAFLGSTTSEFEKQNMAVNAYFWTGFYIDIET